MEKNGDLWKRWKLIKREMLEINEDSDVKFRAAHIDLQLI